MISSQIPNPDVFKKKDFSVFKRCFKNIFKERENSKILVSLSGGSDSVLLLYLMLRFFESDKQNITVAHINHNLRTNSVDDQKFILELGKILKVDTTYRELAMPATQRAIEVFKEKTETYVPIIHYAKGSGHLHSCIRELDIKAISLDWRDDLSQNRQQFGDDIAFQGNLDPSYMHGSVETAKQATLDVLSAAGNKPGHIFNLGHGFAPSAKIDCVETVLRTITEG